ncbi:hypothetical protein [Aegicerativicinus sediminis]|uniref:hypothetical protein n=1 Tax=Aegicerativicinus sediminis TaxID=2893202 RepID=UPI001E6400BE|nr:hypothetical protein [Aegicerativicinus sediminis]
MRTLIFLSAVLLISTSTYSQRNDNAEYWNSWEYTAKEGKTSEFEAAAAKKTAMYNKTATTAILTYRITTGSGSGTYVRVETQKSPSDYDIDRSAEGAYWRDNVAKFVARNSGQVRWQLLRDGTMNYTPGSTPNKHIVRTTFNVKADKVGHFRRYMSRVAEVAKKRGWKGTRLLFRLVSGGNRNQFVVVTGFDTFKRTEEPVEHENTFREDYNEMFGWGTYEEDNTNFDAALEYWGEEVENLELVPEMSTGMMN